MTCYRLIVTLAICVSFHVQRAQSQEAVQSRPDQTTEEPTIETAPPSQEQRTEDKRPESSATAAAEEPAKKPRKKKGVPEQSGKVLQDMMTAQEFKAAGLEKLSPEELKNLNAWLQGYRQVTETKATEKATAEVTKKVATQTRRDLNRVESRVDGTVPHLTGHSVVKLEDGTMWKQANPDDRYSPPPIDHPTAVVTRTPFGWKMRISGLPEFYVDLVSK
jgi:hypothetical protein